MKSTITFDLAEPISWTAYGLFDRNGLVRQLTEEEALEIMGSQPIRAQHEETGRIWEGLRRDLPPRYSEIQEEV